MRILPSRATPGEWSRSSTPPFEPRDVARSIDDCLDYMPWWRSYLAWYYQVKTEEARSRGESLSLPEDEFDPFVQDLYTYNVFGRCLSAADTEDMKWCLATNTKSRINACKIRGAILTGMTDEEIASRFCTTPERIGMFARLFFDIRDAMKCRPWMGTFLFPEETFLSPTHSDSQEMLLLVVGYHLGRKYYDLVADGGIKFLQGDELEDIKARIDAMYVGNTFLHLHSNELSHPHGRATDIERMNRSQEISVQTKAALGQHGVNKRSWAQWLGEAAEIGVIPAPMWKLATSSGDEDLESFEEEPFSRKNAMGLPEMVIQQQPQRVPKIPSGSFKFLEAGKSFTLG